MRNGTLRDDWHCHGAGRDEVARRAAPGEVTQEQFKRENGMLSRYDFSNTSIVAIGGKKLAKPIIVNRKK